VARRRGKVTGIDPRTVARRARRILSALGERDAELSVLLVTDALIRELNRDWRGIDRPTDVLSFPQRDPGSAPSPGACVLGDVVISVETAKRRADKRSLPLLEEITGLLIHGVLHLIGFDHGNDAEEASMEARAKQLMDALRGRISKDSKAL